MPAFAAELWPLRKAAASGMQDTSKEKRETEDVTIGVVIGIDDVKCPGILQNARSPHQSLASPPRRMRCTPYACAMRGQR